MAACRALTVLACVAAALALLTGYLWFAVAGSDQFANRAAAALEADDVRSVVAARVTDEIVLERQADLLAARPLIESVTSAVVGGRAFTGLFRAGVRDLHRALFDQDQDTVVLTVADVGTVVAAALRVLRPSLATEVRGTGDVELLERRASAASAAAMDAARTVRLLTVLLAGLALACAAGALRLAPDRRAGVVRLGAGVAISGVVLAVALVAGRALAAAQAGDPDARAAVRAIWDAFLGDLRTAAWLMAGCGAVVAAAAASLIRPVDLDEPLRRAARAIAAEPARPWPRVLRAIALVLAGVSLLVARDAALALVCGAVGAYLIYAGASSVLRLVERPADARPAASEDAPASSRRGATAVAAVFAVALIAVAVAAFVGTGAATTPAPPGGACNGHAELCGKRLNEVALAATHNSMSAPLPGWFSAAHDRPIAGQLAGGIRGLLIDTHYADLLPNGRLRTDLSGSDAAQTHDGVSRQDVEAALRIRARLGFAGEGERGLYLCHSFCEIGATPLAPVLADIREFLVANPGEVLVIVNQDAISPEDFVGAVRDAGLERFAYRGPVDGRWPTLREMIDSGQRVLFLAENRAGAAPWYHPAYEAILQETPFAFSRPAELTDPAGLAATCRPNRGPASAPLFLFNHWITTDPAPLPSNADRVNAYRPLMARLRECERIRGRMANLVAVDFERRGDVLQAVDTLNGVR